MESFIIEGGHRLHGSIRVNGNKNAALPLLAACLLTEEEVHLSNLPYIGDVNTKLELLDIVGASIQRHSRNDVVICARKLNDANLDARLAKRIRSSPLLASPLLARRGYVEIPRPGGDMIGSRRLDAHFNALREMGAVVEVGLTSYILRAEKLRGADIMLKERSVTATEQVILAAVLAEGETIISNAASEPHVCDLCQMLTQMGADIEGVGTNILRIRGVARLHGTRFVVGPDFMELGAFVSIAAITGSELRVTSAKPSNHRVIKEVFEKLGVTWIAEGDDLLIAGQQRLTVQQSLSESILKVESMPWPGFPTDLMSTTIVLATQVEGTVLFHEKLFDGRLVFVDRLKAMGAQIVQCDPHRVVVLGRTQLYGEEVASPDIRAGMALVVATIGAKGKSVIRNIQQIDRGYEFIEARLSEVGARIVRRET